jgi:hypothetical protein
MNALKRYWSDFHYTYTVYFAPIDLPLHIRNTSKYVMWVNYRTKMRWIRSDGRWDRELLWLGTGSIAQKALDELELLRMKI